MLHSQVKELLERAARSPFPPLHEVPAHVARRIYRETRAALAPKPPACEARLMVFDRSIAVRAYRPAGESGTLPALVYYHGGGWTIGDLDTHDVLCRELAIGSDCAVFSIDYRLAPEHPFPAAVEDCVSATRFVFQNHESLKIDKARIAVGGDSAGGNLAATVALHRDLPVCFQLLIYPATDQRCGAASHVRNGDGYMLTKESIRYFRQSYLPKEKDWTDWRASPLLAASHANLPPAFVLTAGYDPLVDEGRAYADVLRKAGTAVVYKEYEDMVHGFILFGGVLDTARAAVEECCRQLRSAFDKVTA
jgi:acetyl esterase